MPLSKVFVPHRRSFNTRRNQGATNNTRSNPRQSRGAESSRTSLEVRSREVRFLDPSVDFRFFADGSSQATSLPLLLFSSQVSRVSSPLPCNTYEALPPDRRSDPAHCLSPPIWLCRGPSPSIGQASFHSRRIAPAIASTTRASSRTLWCKTVRFWNRRKPNGGSRQPSSESSVSSRPDRC